MKSTHLMCDESLKAYLAPAGLVSEPRGNLTGTVILYDTILDQGLNASVPEGAATVVDAGLCAKGSLLARTYGEQLSWLLPRQTRRQRLAGWLRGGGEADDDDDGKNEDEEQDLCGGTALGVARDLDPGGDKGGH